MTSTDSLLDLLKSGTYKQNVISSPNGNFRKKYKFKTALCGVIQNGSFQSLVFVRFDSFVFV